MTNVEIERQAIEHVLRLDRTAGREPTDLHLKGAPYDIDSPPRKIEVKAFSGSARGAQVPLEDRQVQAAKSDPANFYLYVVDNVAQVDSGAMAVRVIDGTALLAMINRTRPHITYWPSLRAAEYDNAKHLGND
jgi:Protein NO VEIN, C-terminal